MLFSHPRKRNPTYVIPISLINLRISLIISFDFKNQNKRHNLSLSKKIKHRNKKPTVLISRIEENEIEKIKKDTHFVIRSYTDSLLSDKCIPSTLSPNNSFSYSASRQLLKQLPIFSCELSPFESITAAFGMSHMYGTLTTTSSTPSTSLQTSLPTSSLPTTPSKRMKREFDDSDDEGSAYDDNRSG